MGRIEYRAVIKLPLERNVPMHIHQRLVIIYGHSAPYATVKNWAGETRRDRVHLQDEPISGRPVELTRDKKSGKGQGND